MKTLKLSLTFAVSLLLSSLQAAEVQTVIDAAKKLSGVAVYAAADSVVPKITTNNDLRSTLPFSAALGVSQFLNSKTVGDRKLVEVGYEAAKPAVVLGLVKALPYLNDLARKVGLTTAEPNISVRAAQVVALLAVESFKILQDQLRLK